MAVASKKFYKTEEDLHATLNRETGEVDVYALQMLTQLEHVLEQSLQQIQQAKEVVAR